MDFDFELRDGADLERVLADLSARLQPSRSSGIWDSIQRSLVIKVSPARLSAMLVPTSCRMTASGQGPIKTLSACTSYTAQSMVCLQCVIVPPATQGRMGIDHPAGVPAVNRGALCQENHLLLPSLARFQTGGECRKVRYLAAQTAIPQAQWDGARRLGHA